jgi:hypothetical protein
MRQILAAALAAGVIFPAVAQQPVARHGPISITTADVRRLLDAEPAGVQTELAKLRASLR